MQKQWPLEELQEFQFTKPPAAGCDTGLAPGRVSQSPAAVHLESHCGQGRPGPGTEPRL